MAKRIKITRPENNEEPTHDDGLEEPTHDDGLEEPTYDDGLEDGYAEGYLDGFDEAKAEVQIENLFLFLSTWNNLPVTHISDNGKVISDNTKVRNRYFASYHIINPN